METPLKRFKKSHLSPSAINGFRADPVAELKRRFEGIKDADNINMVRGRVAEQVVEMVITNKISEDQVDITIDNIFRNEVAFKEFDDEAKEKTLIMLKGDGKKAKGMVRNMLEAFKVLDVKPPYKFQQDYETKLKGTLTNIKGKTDMENAKVVIDWKATAQIRQIEIDNRVQGGVYWKMTGGKKRIIFVKASKTRFDIQELTPKDIYDGLETAVHVIKTIEHICKTFDNLSDYYKCIYPFKKYDRSEIMETEIKKEYRAIHKTEGYNGI